MSSSDLCLNDFVFSIPICQPDADLGSILRIFQQTNCDLLAVPLADNIWGTISAPNLLVQLAEVWQQQVMMQTHPQNTTATYKDSRLPCRNNWDYLIKPAIVYQGDYKLQEFLTYLSNNCLIDSKQVYLIVDAAGKLLGKLNLEAILKHLVGNSHQAAINNSRLPVIDPSLLNWIDLIALPFKIESFGGRDYYKNKYWQELILTTPELDQQPSLSSDISLVNWWQKQQQMSVPAHTTNYCPNNNYLTISQLPTVSAKNNLIFDSQEYLFDCQISTHWQEDQEIKDSSNVLDIQIKKIGNWYQIKIPITLAKSLQKVESEAKYWLVFAVKALTNNSEQLPSSFSNSADTETIINKLLATVSHELKSPLTGIVGLSNLLQAQKLGALNKRQARYVRLIYNSGQKMMNLVNDLLEITNLTTEKLELKPETINLESSLIRIYQEVLIKLKSSCTTEIDVTHLETLLTLKIDRGLEIAIADPLYLSSILSHLILELIQRTNPLNPPTIAIQRYSSESVAIILNCSSSSPTTDLNLIQSTSDLNLIIAKYLAEKLEGEIISSDVADGCQLTLILPRSSFQLTTSVVNSTSTTNKIKRDFTVLCIYPELRAVNSTTNDCPSLDFNLKNWIEHDWSNNNQQQPDYCYRVIEADGLEQADMLARIWSLDAIVIDSSHICDPSKYLLSLKRSKYLSNLPLITLDTRTTEAANQIVGLNVYPCLLPAGCRSVKDLMQVIEIATGGGLG
ncbi:two-component sensor histidine kinase [Chondrocystis sp. NIES-4102]|nr:two-component sensor histidine kinase [Chondrocystis sp. NIES-4102]